MSKIVDITEKLSFEQNPVLKIKDIEIEVNSDAKTILEIMGNFKTKTEVEASLDSVDKLFSREDQEKLDGLKLQFSDFMAVISAAMELVMGDTQGEQRPVL